MKSLKQMQKEYLERLAVIKKRKGAGIYIPPSESVYNGAKFSNYGIESKRPIRRPQPKGAY